jgi:hypothetical protein
MVLTMMYESGRLLNGTTHDHILFMIRFLFIAYDT